MTTGEQITKEQQKVQELAQRYSSQGYRVLVEPRGEQLPQFLRRFSPDLIAQKDADNLVIEVKRRLSPHERDYWRSLSETVAGQPGWKFQLVLMDLDDIEWSPPAALPGKADLKASLKDVSSLAQKEQPGAALMLLWSIFEAAARHHLSKRGLPPRTRLSSMAIVKQLVSEGIISDADYQRLIPSLGNRNVLAHGFFQQLLSPASMADLMKVTKRLIDRL